MVKILAFKAKKLKNNKYLHKLTSLKEFKRIVMSQKAIHKITKRYDKLANGLSNDDIAKKVLSKVKDLQLSPNPIHFTLLFEALSEIDSTNAKKSL